MIHTQNVCFNFLFLFLSFDQIKDFSFSNLYHQFKKKERKVMSVAISRSGCTKHCQVSAFLAHTPLASE